MRLTVELLGALMDNREQRMKLFERACTVYSKELQRFIYALTRKDLYAMEEIYQNTMLSAWKGLNHLRDDSKFKSWIFVIAKEEARRYYAACRNDNLFAHKSKVEGNLSCRGRVTDFTKWVEDREAVKTLIDSLEEDEQQLYVLHYFYGLPFKEISGILKLNYSTVRSKHIRGIAKMREKLGAERVKTNTV
jgi:RNA polymerase sigma-70 factor (ECF subfamily)